MYEDNLFTPMELENNVNMNITGSQFFINFLNQLEGWKTKCKNLHWAAPKKNIHVYLDEFLAVLSDYQDSLAEEYQGLLGHMQPNAIKGIVSKKGINQEQFVDILKKTFFIDDFQALNIAQANQLIEILNNYIPTSTK